MNKLIYLAIILTVAVSLYSEEQREIPDWQFDYHDYEFSANLICNVMVNYEPEPGEQNILGAFVEDECRGTASPIMIYGQAYYFLSIYANEVGEEISLCFYLSDEDVILNITENLVFVPDEISGSVMDPIIYNAFLEYDNPPEITSIPDQIIDFDASFDDIYLDNYLIELDGDTVVWSYSGAESLEVIISEENTAFICPFDSQWSGTETITFTVTDLTPNGYSDSQDMIFTIRGEDHHPQIIDIPDQTIALGQQFEVIQLNGHLIELDGDIIEWCCQFTESSLTQPVPEWDVNPSGYEQTMSAIIQIISEGETAEGSDHILAAFCDDECRGIASGQLVFDKWIYYLTIYANQNGEHISFRFYDAAKSKDLPVLQNITFFLNGITGTPLEPLVLSAGHYILDINDNNEATVIQVENNWSGTETLLFTVADQGTAAGYSASDEVTFSIIEDNAPQILSIPHQIVTQGEDFDDIALDDYLIEMDDDEVLWSCSTVEHLEIDINSSNMLSISVISEDWVGTETITITATDNTEFAASSSIEVNFTVTGIDHPPVLEGIPDQTIASGMEFEQVLLNDYLTELDGDDIEWSCLILPEDEPQPLPIWAVNPSNYEFTMTVIAEVISEGYQAVDDNHLLGVFCEDECCGTAQAIFSLNRWLYFLTVYSNEYYDEMSFKFYDAIKGREIYVQEILNFSSNSSIGEPLDPLILHAGDLSVDIAENSTASFLICNPGWSGSCNIRFMVQDINTMNNYIDYNDVLFTVIEDHAPEISLIPDQNIMLGDQFQNITLNDYLIELDNDPVNWSYSGDQFLNIVIDIDNIAAITPLSPEWIGSEVICFTAQDNTEFGAFTTQEVSFTVLPEDHAPEISDIPDQVTEAQIGFLPVELPLYLSEFDDDQVQWSYEIQNSDQIDPYPDWEINPSDYEYTMTMTAEVNSKGYTAHGDAHLLAAFTDGECRGVTSAIFTLDSWIYFLNIYSNYNDENIQFKFYDGSFQQIMPVDQEFLFNADQVLGYPLDPVILSAAFISIDIDQQNSASFTIEDYNWLGSENVRFTVTDLGTMNHLSDFDLVNLSVITNTQFILPENISFNEDESSSVDFSQYLINGNPAEFHLSASESPLINIDIDSFEVAFSAEENWYGNQNVSFHIDSQLERYSLLDEMIITVLPVNDLPNILSYYPLETQLSFSDTTEISFTVEYEDIENEVQFAWYINDNLIPDYNLPQCPVIFDQNGNMAIKLEITDGAFFCEHTWYIAIFLIPDWEPVTYPDSTLVYSRITLDGLPVTELDMLAAVVNDELRGCCRPSVNEADNLSYAVMPVYGVQIEEIDFVLYDSSANQFQYLDISYTSYPGHMIGEPFDYLDLTFFSSLYPNWSPEYYSNATIIYAIIQINGEPTTDNDRIAAFYGSECRAVAEIEVIDQIAYATLIVQGDILEYIHFKVWDYSEQSIIPVESSVLSDPGSEIGSSPNQIFIDADDNFNITQLIDMEPGWNLISLNLYPESYQVTELFDEFINAGNLTKIKNIFNSYDPHLPSYYNSLANFDDGGGYYVQIIYDTTLAITGTPVNLGESYISLSTGWNLAGYLPQSPQTVTDAISSIYDNLIIIKDNLNSYNPALPNQFNTMEAMVPGYGYWIKLVSDAILVYPPPTGRYCYEEISCPLWKPVIYPNSTVVYGYALLNDLPVSGYIAAFVNSECRSATPISNGYISLVINGITVETAVFKLLHNGAIYDAMNLITTNPGEIIDNVQLCFNNTEAPENTKLLGIYPNPFNPDTTINYELAEKCEVKIKIYNLKGQFVQCLCDQYQTSGVHQITWKSSDIASGIYLLHFNAGDKSVVKKLSLIK